MNRALVKEFYDWLGTQSGPYQVKDNCACPMAEFAKTKGLKHPIARTASIDEGTGIQHPDDYLEHMIPEVKQSRALDFGVGVYYIVCRAGDYETLYQHFPKRFPEVFA